MMCTTAGCGYTTTDPNERFCPDCGSALVADDNAASTPAQTPASPDLAPPPPPAPDEPMDTRPVIVTVVLPDKTERHLREGDTFTAASERTTELVDLKLADDTNPGVSSQPLTFKVVGGQLKVTGGGTNGFKVTTVVTFKAWDEAMVHKGQTVIAGAKTPFRVK